jgi:polygalacturonase
MYYIPRGYLEGLRDITFELDGYMILHDDISAWYYSEDNETYMNAIDIRNSSNVTITGSGEGVMDGQGWEWWLEFYKGNVNRRRPTMIEIDNSIDVLIEKITMLNSPRFHIYCDNVLRLEVQYLTIWVEADNGSGNVFPYNTDGVDFSGKDIHIHDLVISNYDDSICVKPLRNTSLSLDGKVMNCSENILVENVKVYFGAGLSIGSVSSSKQNCIRNVVFQNIHAKKPLKFIYVKTGEVDEAEDVEGLIENIVYQNMTATGGVLWPIYIGPQQQKEPDGSGEGVWPEVNPYVTIRNIVLENIKVKNIYGAAGVLRCGVSNPCEEISFRNVVVGSRNSYVCSEKGTLLGTYDESSEPGLKHCGLVGEGGG